MYRFFVKQSQIDQGHQQIQITGPDVNHIVRVLRMKPGEQIVVSAEEKQEYTCMIREMTDEQVLADIMYVQEVGLELPCHICLFQGLPKGDKMEWIIQKAVELGVNEIVPMATSRVVVKLDDKKKESKRKRWQGISESAAKQSKRMRIPEVHPVVSFQEAVRYASSMDVRLIPYELAQDMTQTRQILEQIEAGQSVAIMIGPEGGFSREEVELALEAGITSITLGKRILRTETAGMTLLSILMFLLEGKGE